MQTKAFKVGTVLDIFSPGSLHRTEYSLHKSLGSLRAHMGWKSLIGTEMDMFSDRRAWEWATTKGWKASASKIYSSSIETYVMSIFMLFTSLHEQIYNFMNVFWWKGSSQAIRWFTRENVS